MVVNILNESTNEQVAFLQMRNLMIETYENNNVCENSGAIDHIAIDVSDIEKVFRIIKEGNYKVLDEEILYLLFWEKEIRFFNIEGPNSEKIEFV